MSQKEARASRRAGPRKADRKGKKVARAKGARTDGGPPPNRRRKPKEPEKAAPPPPSLRQRGRIAKDRAVAVWARARGPVVVAGKVLLAVVVALGAVGMGTLIEQHLRTSPAFATRHLTLEGNHRLSDAELETVAGLKLGQNVFEVSPEEARARLLRDPWVAEAHVSRKLPDTLRVEVREHEPAALLGLDGVVYLVSDEGSVFKRAGPADPSDLPVVTGVDRHRFTTDETFRTSLLTEVVALLHDYRGAGLWRREPIGEIHLEPDDGLSLYIGDDATLARLGHGPYRAKLTKLRRVLDRLDARKAQAAYVYLDNIHRPDRITVKLR